MRPAWRPTPPPEPDGRIVGPVAFAQGVHAGGAQHIVDLPVDEDAVPLVVEWVDGYECARAYRGFGVFREDGESGGAQVVPDGARKFGAPSQGVGIRALRLLRHVVPCRGAWMGAVRPPRASWMAGVAGA